MEHLRIDIEPAKVGSRGQRYNVIFNDQLLIEASLNPANDAARELVARGFDIDSMLLVYRKMDPMLRLSGRLGAFAATKVSEGQNHGPRFALWQPYNGPGTERDDDAEDD